MCDVASSDDPYPLFQDTVDNTDERIGLRADRRPRPDITRWHRIAQQLPDRARVDPKTTRRFALAQTLNHYRVARPPIQFHSLHPPPFAPKCKGLSLTEFCSGATRLSGRFSEGLLLRRSQFMEVRHYCRPPGLPRCERSPSPAPFAQDQHRVGQYGQQLWLATVLRKGCVCSIFNHAVVTIVARNCPTQGLCMLNFQSRCRQRAFAFTRPLCPGSAPRGSVRSAKTGFRSSGLLRDRASGAQCSVSSDSCGHSFQGRPGAVRA